MSRQDALYDFYPDAPNRAGALPMLEETTTHDLASDHCLRDGFHLTQRQESPLIDDRDARRTGSIDIDGHGTGCGCGSVT
jgi:hypothetical protein